MLIEGSIPNLLLLARYNHYEVRARPRAGSGLVDFDCYRAGTLTARIRVDTLDQTLHGGFAYFNPASTWLWTLDCLLGKDTPC